MEEDAVGPPMTNPLIAIEAEAVEEDDKQQQQQQQ